MLYVLPEVYTNPSESPIVSVSKVNEIVNIIVMKPQWANLYAAA